MMTTPAGRKRLPIRRQSLATLTLLLVAAGFTSGCDRAAGEDDVRDATRVVVIAAATGEVERTESSIGQVETFSAPTVSPEVDARVVEILVDVGDKVERGDVLARIDREPFALRLGSAGADRARMEVERTQLQSDLERMESVAEEGYVSESEIENTRSSLDAIEAELESIRFSEEQAATDLRRTDITSPISGEIDSRTISEGDYVSVGDDSFRVSPLSAYRVSLGFPQGLRDVLAVGQEVRLAPADNPDEQAVGEVTRIRPSVDGGSRSLIAVVDFDDPGG